MLKEKDAILRRLLMVVDLALVVAAFFVGYFLISHFKEYFSDESVRFLYPLHYYFNLIPLLLTLWGVSLYLLGLYRTFRGRDLASNVGCQPLLLLGHLEVHRTKLNCGREATDAAQVLGDASRFFGTPADNIGATHGDKNVRRWPVRECREERVDQRSLVAH